MQWLEIAGKAAGYISAIAALATLLFGPVRRKIKKCRDARKMAKQDQLAFRAELKKSLADINATLASLSDDIGDLQYERLSQAQDFYTSRGWCPGAKKEMLCKMHASYRAKGRNHLSEHYEDEILRLADKPEEVNHD